MVAEEFCLIMDLCSRVRGASRVPGSCAQLSQLPGLDSGRNLRLGQIGRHHWSGFVFCCGAGHSLLPRVIRMHFTNIPQDCRGLDFGAASRSLSHFWDMLGFESLVLRLIYRELRYAGRAEVGALWTTLDLPSIILLPAVTRDWT